MKASRLAVLISAAVLIVFTGCARDPKPGTPEAAALGDKYMHAMSDALVKAQTFTFDTDEQLQVLTPGGEKREMALSRKVTVRRPNAVAFLLHGKGDNAPDVAAFYDGKTATLSNMKTGVFAQTRRLKRSTVCSILSLLNTACQYQSPTSCTSLRTLRTSAGRETIDGVSYAVVNYADDVVGVKLWIPVNTLRDKLGRFSSLLHGSR